MKLISFGGTGERDSWQLRSEQLKLYTQLVKLAATKECQNKLRFTFLTWLLLGSCGYEAW
jgi:hypothetical protein